MEYVKVVNKKVVEYYRPRGTKDIVVPKGENWLPLEQVKPTFNAKKEFLVHSHYETLNNKVLEHFKIETINIYYAKVNDVSELETENIRNGTKALVNNVEYVFRKGQWVKK